MGGKRPWREISDLGLYGRVDGQLARHFLGCWRRCGLRHPTFAVMDVLVDRSERVSGELSDGEGPKVEGRLSGLVEGHSSDSCDRNNRCVTDLTLLFSSHLKHGRITGFLPSHHLYCNSVHSANCATPQLTRLSCR